MNDIQYAALTQIATAPLTAAYCHQLYRRNNIATNGYKVSRYNTGFSTELHAQQGMRRGPIHRKSRTATREVFDQILFYGINIQISTREI